MMQKNKANFVFKFKEAEKAESKLAVIACFDDPFLLEARRTISIPTIGIGWAALQCVHFIVINSG